MTGNCPVRFLGEKGREISLTYPTKVGKSKSALTLSNRIVKNWQKFVGIILFIVPTDMKTIFPHKNQTVKLRNV